MGTGGFFLRTKTTDVVVSSDLVWITGRNLKREEVCILFCRKRRRTGLCREGEQIQVLCFFLCLERSGRRFDVVMLQRGVVTGFLTPTVGVFSTRGLSLRRSAR